MARVVKKTNKVPAPDKHPNPFIQRAWEESQPFQLGCYYEQLGALLKNPNTSIKDLFSFAKAQDTVFVVGVQKAKPAGPKLP